MWHDIVFAIRSLRRQPAFALLVVAVLAIGIGSATAIANVYGSVLLTRLPVREQDRIVVMWGENRGRQFAHVPLTLERFREFRQRSNVLESAAAADYNGAWPRLFRDKGEPLELIGLPVSGDFFDVLGATPTIGRVFRADDDVSGAPPRIVISHAAWQNRFGSDSAIVGRTLQLVSTGGTFTVVGVMRPGFEYPRGAEFWTTIEAYLSAQRASGADTPEAYVDVVGRLKPGASLALAQRELTAFFGEETGPIARGSTAVAHTFSDRIVGDVRPALRLLVVAVGLLLLVACANAANLLLIRGVERARELGVRAALGAGRLRLVRQQLTESSLLAIAGGVLGALLSVATLRVLIAVAPAELPRMAEIQAGGAVVWAAVLTIFATALFGIVPALWSAGQRARGSLVGGSRWSSERRNERVAKDGLVAAQIALAILILASAGLVGRSLSRLQRQDVGFATERVLIAQLGWPAQKYSDVARAIALYDRLLVAAGQTPGVVSAAPLLTSPFSGTGGWDGAFVVEDQSRDAEERSPILNMEVGSPGFFATMGIPLRSGRVFSDRDRRDAPKVVMISEGAAHALWPGQDAIGKRIKLGARATAWWTVIGVAGDTRYREFRTARATVYFPLQQLPFPYPPTNLVVRTANDPASVVAALRHSVATVDADVVIARAQAMTALLDEPLAQPRLNALLLAIFAGVVVLIAAIGLYGVLAWTVRHRSRELGIRLALGARPSQLHALVVRRGMLIAGAGTVAGIAGAIAASRFLQSLLFEISPTDPVTIVAASGLLLVVALLATLTPARRATRVDPMVALRND